MAVDSVPRSRRAILMGAMGGVVAATGAALGRPAAVRAGVDGDVVLSAINVGTATTEVQLGVSPNPAILGTNTTASGVGLRGTGPGYGVVGVSAFVGVEGQSDTGEAGVRGLSTTGMGAEGRSFDTGVRGVSLDDEPTEDFNVPSHNTGVIGIAGGTELLLPGNTDETGVYGLADLSPISTGVWGDSGQGFGVFGSGDIGVGGSGFIGVNASPVGAGAIGLFAGAGNGEAAIYGYAGTTQPPAPIQNVAIQARAGSTSQVALNVTGKAQFSRSGRTTMSAGSKKKTITMAGVTTASYVVATLQTKLDGVYVQSVVPANGSFAIYLNKSTPSSTVVGYMVIN